MPGLLVDERFCMGCHACEVACKQEHGLPEGPRLIRVEPVAPGAGAAGVEVCRPTSAGASLPRSPQWHVSVCRHCDEPDCVDACPSGALERADGVVRVLTEQCTGCRACADACAFDAPRFHPETGVVLLCDLCHERTAALGRPACVHHCPALALEGPVVRRR